MYLAAQFNSDLSGPRRQINSTMYEAPSPAETICPLLDEPEADPLGSWELHLLPQATPPISLLATLYD